MQTQTKHLLTQTVTSLLEHGSRFSSKRYGIHSVSRRSLHLYYKDTNGEKFYMGVYVDDIILAGRSQSEMKQIKADLSRKFNSKDLGKLSYFLEVKIEQDEENGSVWIGQCAYTESLFGMKDSNPVSTPVDVGLKLTNATEEEDSVDQPLYQSAIVSLMYLSVSTRPDISYAVSSLARFSSKPTRQHWIALKR